MNQVSKQFEIPIVLFTFKRYKTVLEIIKKLEIIKPNKIYLISDGPRNSDEELEINQAREIIESAITWNCLIVKNYAEKNVGIYDRIGEGAKWVLRQEEHAIFLEDDNLPEISFFKYCEELLYKFKEDSRILWICGTNYLEEYFPEDGSSYMFTQHLLPCGWASWSHKFEKYYDGEMRLAKDPKVIRRIKKEYTNSALYKQQINSINSELYRVNKGERVSSWDFQMAISLRAQNLYGISPSKNLIRNIGVDDLSTHGGNSFSKVMTRRFCGIDSFKLNFPLKHPKTVLPDLKFEKKLDKIILFPLNLRIKAFIARAIKKLFRINRYEKFKFKFLKN